MPCPSGARKMPDMLSALLLLAPVAVPGADAIFVAPDLHVAIASETQNEARFARVFGLGVQSGRRWGKWGVFGRAEANLWFSPADDDDDEVQGSLNLGVGGEVITVGGLIQTSVVAGPTILLRGADTDDPGQVGMFGELRPAGLRFDLESTVLTFHPLSCAIVIPVLGGIPLVEIQFRTTVMAEFLF